MSAGPDLVVAFHQNVGAQLAENLREVVGERIIIIDQEEFQYATSFARAIAARTAIALRSVSSRSRTGSESATIPGAGLYKRFPVFQNHRTQRNATIAIPVEAEPADRPRVKTTSSFLQLGDDLHGANLRRARNGAGGKGRAKGIEGGQTITQPRLNVRNDVHDVAVTFDRHLLGHADAADLRDPAQIVSREID